ncbi:MAG: RNA polymerase sigma factor [Kofleriaceae bacterium]
MSAKLVPLRRVGGDTGEMSDEALLAACATGDSAALGALFDRFHAIVYRFAGRLATTDDLARDDLVQTTFLEVRRCAAAFRGTSSVRSWVLGIAVNVARHALRGERRRRARQAQYVERVASIPNDHAFDDHLDQRKLLARVEQTVATLSHDLQVAFVLCDLEGLPCAEVAAVLAIPEGTLWRRLHTARKLIRASVEGTA